MKPNAPFVVSISRQLGSGAAFVGQQLAKRLGVFYADREIIRKAAEELSVLEEDVSARDEAVPSFWQSLMDSSTIMPDMYVPPKLLLPTERELFEAESAVIERMAREGSAILIGRCGFHVLREHPNHLSVFLHAALAFRSARVQKVYHATQEAAEKMLAKSDKERASYCKNFTGRDWADARGFDLSIDASRLDDLDKVTDLILHCMKLR